jgi:hypothetical protein
MSTDAGRTKGRGHEREKMTMWPAGEICIPWMDFDFNLLT